MKKLIFILLILVTTNMNATVVVSHSTRRVPVDNSLQASLTRKDYHFRCKKCGRDFVIYNMLYHENTDIYFYYMQDNNIKILQPYDSQLCDECANKLPLEVKIILIIIILVVVGLGIFIFKNV